MDNGLLRWINRLANRTGWAHGFFTAYAKYGIVLFAVLLIVAYLDSVNTTTSPASPSPSRPPE